MKDGKEKEKMLKQIQHDGFTLQALSCPSGAPKPDRYEL
jgi:hypothetical protein